jgi:hypothetical protein
MAKKNDDLKEKKDNVEEKKRSKTAVIFVILGVIIILLLVVVIILLLKGGKKDDQPVAAETTDRQIAGSIRTVVDEADARNIMDEMREEVAEGMFKCDMSLEWNYINGGAISRDAYVANHPDNKHPLYFDVYLEDTDEVIYSSPVLKVGTTWTEFALDKKLEPGSYRAVVQYTLLKDEESQEELSKAEFVVLLNVID